MPALPDWLATSGSLLLAALERPSLISTSATAPVSRDVHRSLFNRREAASIGEQWRASHWRSSGRSQNSAGMVK